MSMDKESLSNASSNQDGLEDGRISIDNAPLSKFHIKMTVVTFGAYLTAGYIIGSIAFALIGLTNTMEVSPVWQGLLGSSALIGVFVGGILTGVVADKIGRKKVFLFSFVVVAIASALQFFASGPIDLFILRLIVGIAVGADYSVGVTLLTEILPRKYRGPLLGTLVAVWTLGYVLGSVIGAYVITAPEDWNLLLATAAIPAVIVILMRTGVPESPRWLMRMGRKEEAQEIVNKYFGPQYVVLEEKVEEGSGGYGVLFTKRYSKRLIFTSLFWAFNVIPYFGVYTFLPIILGEFGMQSSNEIDILLNMALLAGGIIGIWLIAKLSRRSFSISTSVVSAVGLLLLVVLPDTMVALQIVAFALFTIAIAAQGDLTPIYPSEVFPTEVRSTAVGLTTGASRIASAIGTFALPVIIASAGIWVALGILGAICAINAVICIFMAPETKYLELADASGQDQE